MFGALKIVGTLLNENNIKWAIGGSLILNHFNLCDTVNDIDIIVSKEDEIRANELMNTVAIKQKTKNKDIYKTDSFNEYRLEGTNIDIISGFKIEHELGIYEYVFDQNAIGKTVDIKGTPIPLSRLEDWYVIYQLLPNRDEKIDVLEDYFKNKKNYKTSVFNRILEGTLPNSVKENILKYI